MKTETEPPTLRFDLWLGEILVASITEAFPHQGTWFGNYSLRACPEDGPGQQRICDYVRFCENWHERMNDGEDVDPAEFDAYADVVGSDRWRVNTPAGRQIQINDAPSFVMGEVSWNHPDEAPSPEVAANEAWERLTKAEAQSVKGD